MNCSAALDLQIRPPAAELWKNVQWCSSNALKAVSGELLFRARMNIADCQAFGDSLGVCFARVTSGFWWALASWS